MVDDHVQLWFGGRWWPMRIVKIHNATSARPRTFDLYSLTFKDTAADASIEAGQLRRRTGRWTRLGGWRRARPGR